MRNTSNKIVIFFALFFVGTNLNALFFDFEHLSDARKYFDQKDFNKSANSYAKVNSPWAKYNTASALYKGKQYEKAVKTLESIDKEALEDEELKFKILHNLGNNYAFMGKLNDAVKAYEEALVVKYDKDTFFNLEVMKKEIDKQKKKQDKKDGKDKNDKDKQDKDKKQEDKDDKNKQDKKDGDKKQDDKNQKQDKKDDKSKLDKEKKQSEEEKKKKEQEKKKKEQQAQENNETKNQNDVNKSNQPISNMEERKWQKMLDQKGVRTLLVPIRQGEDLNENNNW